MSVTQNEVRHPAQREELEAWMDNFGVSYNFDPDVDPNLIDFDRSLQNQARINYPLNDTTVDIYTEAMQRGDIFPASILYWNQGKLLAVDGNHRLKAKFNTGKPIEAYLLAKNTRPQVTMLMTFEANAKHGLPNSVEERTEHAMVLIAAGAKKEDAAIRLNLTSSQVTRRWDNLRSTQKAAEAGITPSDWAKVPTSGQNRLAAIRETEVFKRVAQLCIKARLNTTEINTLVVETNKNTSMANQLEFLEQQEQVFADRIQDTGAGVLGNTNSGWNSPRTKLALAITNSRRLVEVYGGSEENLDSLIKGIHQAEIPRYVSDLRVQSAGLAELADALEKKGTDATVE